MIHTLKSLEDCQEAEERVRRALHDAIVDGATPELFAIYRAELAEISVALEALEGQIPTQRKP